MYQSQGSIAAFESDIKKLKQYLDENTEGRPIHGVEREILALVLATGRSMLAAYAARVGTGDVGTHLDEGREWRRHGTHDQTYRSIFGPVPIVRTYYNHAEQGGFCPLDATLALPERGYSYVLQGFAHQLAAYNAHDTARDTLADLLGVTMPKAMIEATLEEAAREVPPFWQQQGVPDGEGAVIVIEADAKGINMVRPADKEPGPKMRRKKGEKRNKKKMANIFTIQTVDPVPETQPATLNRKTYGFLCPKREAFERIVAEVAKRRVGRTKVLFLSDGDPDLTALAREYFPCAEHCVDWIHVVERLWTAAYLFYKEGSAQANEWVAKGKDLLMEGKVGTVLRGLKQRLTKGKRLNAAKRATLAKVIGYLEGVKDRIPYDEFWAAGLPISTGSVEGGCRHLVCDRMERAGMHWKEPGAQAMLYVRAVHINGDAKAFEAFRIAREQERLYGNKPNPKVIDLAAWKERTIMQTTSSGQASHAASA